MKDKQGDHRVKSREELWNEGHQGQSLQGSSCVWEMVLICRAEVQGQVGAEGTGREVRLIAEFSNLYFVIVPLRRKIQFRFHFFLMRDIKH